MRLTCADPACDRPPMRERDGQRFCLFHPDQQAPEVDKRTGKLRGKDGKQKAAPKPSEILTSKAKPARNPRPPRRVVQAPADGMCPHCPRPWRHPGAHSGTVDRAEAARRYQAGEGLDMLSASMRVRASTMREALIEEGVTLRRPGQRSTNGNTIDTELVRHMYADGQTVNTIARALKVRYKRVSAVLQEHGDIKYRGSRTDDPRVGRITACVTLTEEAAMQQRAAELGESPSVYVRSLITADLQAQGRLGQAVA